MSNNRNRIIFPAEYGRLQPQLAPAVQGGEPTYTIYLLYQDGTVYPLAGDETLEIIYQDTSDDAVYSTTTGLSVNDAEAGIVTWEAAAALGLAGSFWLQLKVNDEISLRVKWKVEAALDASGAVPPVAMTSLTAAQVALVQTLATLSGLANFNGSGSAAAIKLNLAATTDPTADDDSGDGYTVWSGWANIQDNKAWLCLSAAAGAAVWLEITGGGAVWGSITGDIANQTDLVAELDAISGTVTTLANLIAAAQSGLNNHVADTANPHQVTAAQAGALATANNLSELTATASTARTNIGAGTGDGDVIGPASSLDNEIPRFHLTTGKIIQSGTNAPTYDDAGRISSVNMTLTETPGSHAAAPTFALGDGDTGFYESADDFLRVSTGGVNHFMFWNDGSFHLFGGAGGTDYQLRNITPSATVPGVIVRGDYTAGLGYIGTGRIPLISNNRPAFMPVYLSGIVGSAVPVIPNGTGDVTLALSGTFTVSDGAGNVAGGVITATAPGGSFNLYDDGGTNTCQLQVAADGSVTVVRTAGSRTYAVNLNLNWM